MASIAATAGVHTRAAFVLVCCLLAVSCVAAPAPFNDGRTSDSAASMKEGREQVARLSEAATRRVTKKFEDAAKAIASVRIAGRNAIAQKIADNRKDCVECKGRYFMTEKLVEQTMMDKTMTSGNHDGLWGEARSPMGGVAPAKHNNAPPHWFKPKGTWTGKMTIFGIYAGKFTADMMVAIKVRLCVCVRVCVCVCVCVCVAPCHRHAAFNILPLPVCPSCYCIIICRPPDCARGYDRSWHGSVGCGRAH